MNADQRARAFAIEVEIADMELAPRAFDLLRIIPVDRAGQTIFGIIGDPQRIVEIVAL